MSRGFADRVRLAAFAARRALRTGWGQINAHPTVRWRFTPAMADRLLIAVTEKHRRKDLDRLIDALSGV